MTDNKPPNEPARKSEEPANSRRQLRHQRVQKVIKYLGFGGSGVGISGTVGLIMSGQPAAVVLPVVVAIGGTFLAIAYKFVSGVTNRVLDLIEEELEKQEEPLARWIVNLLKTFFVGLWWKLNSRFQYEYYQSLVDTFRELKVDGFRVGLPVLDLENVFVSLRVATGLLEGIGGGIVPARRESESQEVWDYLGQISKFPAYRRLAIIASPGSGKTTLLKHLTLIYAKKQHQRYKAPKLIPVLLYLRDIRHLIIAEKPSDLPNLIRDHIKKLPAPEPLNPPPNWIEDQLKIGRCLVMLDGLDEVADASEREQVSQWVNQQMKAYRKTVFILTSRPHGYRSAPVEQVGTVLEVLPFNSEQVRQFIQSWYLQTEIMSRAGRDTPAVRDAAKSHAEDLIERIMDNRAISDMAKNPLLVTMIATVHFCGSALPGRRVELYQKICDLLLGPRQEAKKIKTTLTGEQNKSVLQVLALALMQKKTREFTIREGEVLIQQELEKVASSTLPPEQFLIQIKELSGLIVERELGVYEFAHLSFQEYLAASQVKELQQDDLLAASLNDPWWAETIRLYAAQGDATRLIEEAIAQPTVNSLSLALDCLQEAAKIEPATREKLLELLEAGLESNDRQIAKLAAEVSLLRRLENLFEVDECVEIDLKCITCAEYQLFADEQLAQSETSRDRFEPRNARNPITSIDFKTALGFCTWLNLKAPSLRAISESSNIACYYRLPSIAEAQMHKAQSHAQLGYWTIEENHSQTKGIRIVRATLHDRYTQLAKYLAAEEWEKADRETVKVILKAANRDELDVAAIENLSAEDIQTIDRLWLYYSQGLTSLGVQVSLWERLGGNPVPGYFPFFLLYSNDSVSPRDILEALARKCITCNLERLSFERSLPQAAFEVVTVNAQGQETQRQRSQACYFTENLAEGGTHK